MNIIRLKADYARVRDLAIEGNISTEVDPRCHEMACLIDSGMKWKGYNSRVEDGIYIPESEEYSWVRIKGGGDDVIIRFKFHPHAFFFSPPTYHEEFCVDKNSRKKYKKRKLDYKLAEGTVELAARLFPEAAAAAKEEQKKSSGLYEEFLGLLSRVC